MYLQGAKDRVRAASFPDQEDIHACTPEEVQVLERKVGYPLPAAVREFLLWCGKGLGEIWSGARCLGYEELLEPSWLDAARNKLVEAGYDSSVLDGALVFQFDEDGQFAFVRLDDVDDPPVYGLNEGEPLQRHCDHFSQYVSLIVEQEFGTPGVGQTEEGPGKGSAGGGGEDGDFGGAPPFPGQDVKAAPEDGDIIPPESRNDPGLREVSFGFLPPSVQEQMGRPRAAFRSSGANVAAGIIFGIIFVVFGSVLMVWLIVQAAKTGFNMPVVAERNISWVTFMVAELLACLLALAGVVMLARLRKISGDVVFLGEQGICLMHGASYEVLLWSAVAEIEELVIREHAPVKRIGAFIPAGKDRMYTVRLNNRREFRFNSTNVRRLALFRAILERVALLNRISWSTRECNAAHLV